MKKIHVEPFGFAILVDNLSQIPAQYKFFISIDGYRLYKTSSITMYAIEE